MARGCCLLLFWLVVLAPVCGARGEYIARIWLTHPVRDASVLMVNWTTETPGPSRVDFGPTAGLGSRAGAVASVGLHQVPIPFPASGDLYYRVSTGNRCSAVHRVKSYGGDELRVAFAANWRARPSLDALVAADPHVLVSCGDLVPDVIDFQQPGGRLNVGPFLALVGAYPALFARTPFLAVPGNHDRQVGFRLVQPPAAPVYDLEASAFRRVFPLPEGGTMWHVDWPAFDLRLVGLDLSHTADGGTTWQSCPDFGPDSAQLRWYRGVMGSSAQRHVVTVYNEWHHLMGRLAEGAWMGQIRRGSAAVSGFGLFSERADFEGLPCFNTSLATGPIYGHGGRTRFYQKAPGFLLLRFPRGGGPMAAEFVGLNGSAMNRSLWPGRASGAK